jgi:hypothetical protein
MLAKDLPERERTVILMPSCPPGLVDKFVNPVIDVLMTLQKFLVNP